MLPEQPHELIRYVQIETGTACNYRCLYCPVAFWPRRGGFLPLDVVARLARELTAFPALEQLYLNGYDEPTLNPQLPEVFRLMAPVGARIVLLTNGTRLTAALAERIIASGADVVLDVHLSAGNAAEFERVHQSHHFDRVIRNLTELAQSPVAEKTEIHVSMQGLDDDEYTRQAFRELQTALNELPFKARMFVPNDRSGVLRNQYLGNHYVEKLRGCGLQNRTLEWLHINANGNAVLCCQDYFEQYVLGDVAESTLVELANAPMRRTYHRWTTGDERAPDSYICRRCSHAVAG